MIYKDTVIAKSFIYLCLNRIVFMKFFKFILLSISIIGLNACTSRNNNPKMTKDELDQKLDSIIPIRLNAIESTFMADYNLRKSILMKPIIDSLLQRDTAIPTIKNPTNNE